MTTLAELFGVLPDPLKDEREQAARELRVNLKGFAEQDPFWASTSGQWILIGQAYAYRQRQSEAKKTRLGRPKKSLSETTATNRLNVISAMKAVVLENEKKINPLAGEITDSQAYDLLPPEYREPMVEKSSYLGTVSRARKHWKKLEAENQRLNAKVESLKVRVEEMKR